MAKKSNDIVDKVEKIKVIKLVKGEGIALGYEIYEVDSSLLNKESFKEKSEPDIFPIFGDNMLRYFRKYFDL
jgi:hypothetical protein